VRGVVLQSGAHAVALNQPSGNFANTALPGTTVAARPELAGLVLEDVLTTFNFDGVSGTVQNRVVRETTTGTLDFYWKIDVDANASGLGIDAFRLINGSSRFFFLHTDATAYAKTGAFDLLRSPGQSLSGLTARRRSVR
jgi:hypothetical protein